MIVINIIICIACNRKNKKNYDKHTNIEMMNNN